MYLYERPWGLLYGSHLQTFLIRSFLWCGSEMDSYEATQIVFSRVQSLDPENVSKIMGYLLLQDNGDGEMIRLALGPQALLQSLVFKAKKELGLMLKSPAFCNYLARIDRTQFPLQSQLVLPSLTAVPPHAVDSWVSHAQQNSKPLPSSPHGIVPNEQNNSNNNKDNNNNSNDDNDAFSNLGAPCFPDQANKFPASHTNEQVIDGVGDNSGLQDQRSFLPDSPKSNNSHTYVNPYQPPGIQAAYLSGLNPLRMHNHDYHRLMDCSTTNGLKRLNFNIADMRVAPERGVSSAPCKPCMYFARGFCKNGSNCRFLHSSARVGSDSVVAIEKMQAAKSFENFELELQEYFRGRRSPVSIASLPYLFNERFGIMALQAGKNYWAESPRIHGQHAVVLAPDDVQRFERCRNESNNSLTGAGISPGSRQIYLTFPADSVFSEVDVSNYFSIYGPVQDVRIPYQQKRMFGFVTFVYPGTVKMILAKGNPHYVCDARVLVKPYREKGKPAADRRYIERGQYSGYVTTNNLESKDWDWHPGPPRSLENTELIRTQQEVEQTMELQRRQLADLHLFKGTKGPAADCNHEDFIAAITGHTVDQAGHQKSTFSDETTVLQSHEEDGEQAFETKLALEDLDNSTLSDHFGYLLQVLDSPTYEERPKPIGHQQERLPINSTQGAVGI